MNVLIHIPARAGSKRLPGKNLCTVGGKSLVAHAAECGRAFAERIALDGHHALVVIDTDSQAIANAALDAGAHAWWPRWESVSGDDATSEKTVLAACSGLGFRDGAVVLLQPTSPLRALADAMACWHAFGCADRLVVSTTDGARVPNGAVYICLESWLRQNQRGDMRIPPRLFTEPRWSLLVPMPPERSIDINTAEDLAEAERLWQERPAHERIVLRSST